jgi:hypothetical protein
MRSDTSEIQSKVTKRPWIDILSSTQLALDLAHSLVGYFRVSGGHLWIVSEDCPILF